MVTRTFNNIYRIAFVSVMSMMMAGCEDTLLPEDSLPELDRYQGEKVLLSAGTTENSITTRADAKTYYMPADHRFVCKMYFKTRESDALYDTLRAHTAWLKVDNGGAGNSLYWKKNYPETAQKLDHYNNDEYAPTFYWQNRKEHAFLAWTDLNKATEGSGDTWLNFNGNLTSYAFHTGRKEQQWVEKTITVHGESVPFANEKAVLNAYKTSSVSSPGQGEYKNIAKTQVTPSGEEYYWWSADLEDFCKVVVGSDAGEDKGENKKTSPRHLMYFFKNKLEYSIPDGVAESSLRTQTINLEGKDFEFVIDENNDPVARKVVENGVTKYYQCTTNGHIKYDESLSEDDSYTVFIFRRNLQYEQVDIVEDYPAMEFDLSKGSKTAMSQQPDILQALTIDQKPLSAIMEVNRVHLFFKHQFAQVQVNLKNSVDNSVQITDDQIKKVELLGVTNTGYMFINMNPDGTMNVPRDFKSSTFKEVVATDFSDTELESNPYGTSFEMFDRTLTNDDVTVSKILKSYECITFGRLQAIRITWQESDTTDPVTGDRVPGIEHVATYRVPEKNDHNQPLRLLEQGKKYIWNMELRRGTLAVVRTEIIPWEENQEEYNADGFIVQSASSN